MYQLMFVLVLFVGMALVGIGAAYANEDGSVVADRTPLTFRDSGLYANYSMTHGPTPAQDGTTSLLTTQRAASTDSPWSFYIIQYNPMRGNVSTRDENSTLREMAANGKKVVLRVKLADRHHAELDLEECKARLTKMFEEQVDPDWLYAITLDEENVYWGGNIETLSELYHWCKEQWPDLPVYQWWTPMEVPNARAERGWVALPADGWVIDLYLEEQKDFERKLVMALETGKPVIHIVWSSPTWPIYRQGDYDADEWWEKVGRPSFEEQVDICRGYNVPVAHFMTQPREEIDGERVAGIRWGWHATDWRVREHYQWLEAYAKNLRHITDASFGYRTLDEKKFDWAHTSEKPQGFMYDINEQGLETVTVELTASEIPTSPGRYTLVEQGVVNGFYITYDVPEAGSVLLDDLVLRGQEGRVARIPLAFTIHQEDVVGDLVIEVNGQAFAGRGGSLAMSYTIGDQSAMQPVHSDSEKRRQTLTLLIPEAEQQAGKNITVEVMMVASAGVRTQVASQIYTVRFTRVNE